MNDLEQLVKDLQRAATVGAAQAGSAAVAAGAMEAEIGMRAPGAASGVAAHVGSLHARIGVTQRRGVYQEAAPALAPGIDAGGVASTMADVAVARGAAEVVE